MPSIAFIVPEMLPVPPVQGGAVEGWVHDVSRALAGQGFDVTVVSRPADGATAGDDVRYVGVPWSRVGRWWYERKRSWGRLHPVRPLVKLVNVLEYGLAVRRALSGRQFDVVYIHNDPYLAGVVGRSAGRALVLHMHNDHLSAKAARPLLSRIVGRCDRVLCVSDFIRDRARAAFPGLATRIDTVLNAIELPSPEERTARGSMTAPQFLYAGRLVPEKGVGVLLAAFAQVRDSLPRARLTIAGSSFFARAPRPAFERGLRLQAESLGDSVAFAGFIPRERLWRLYRQADAVIVPSTWDEPFGLVVLEAMASGACVIASRVGGIPELIDDGRTGLLVPGGDAAALARSMLCVAVNPGSGRRLGVAARDEALRRFSLSRLTSEIACCFRSLALEQPKARGRPDLPHTAVPAARRAAPRSISIPSSKDNR